MPLSPGQRIGAYEIVGQLGAGGMGEVYRARDSKLKREVAIKVLPADVASDRERLARFQREAEALASLNHPHIAHVYGIEENALVMELVEGEDLSQRIARGPIPLDEALPIAKQIAEALEAAHDAGIIHRDLKPANIKVRDDGTVKVLDFGLAKAVEQGPGAGDPRSAQLANSPTITSPAMTVRGVILGTAAYMSPEQAKGKVVDKRADIWAFGCVLFEMLTGKRAFEGDGVAEIFAAIITKEPDWSMLPTTTPVSVCRVLHRALHKDVKHRLRDAGDARIDFDDVGPAELRVPRVQRLPILSAALLLALIAAVAIAVNVARSNDNGGAPTTATRFTIPLPADTTVASVAISRSGELIAYEREDTAAAGNSAETQLFVHRLAQFDSTPISNTFGAHHPFFSPDGAWIGFFAHGQLLRVPSGGGTPQVICETSLGWGATWADDDTITFASPSSSTIARALHSVSALGGTITDLMPPISGAASGRWPTVFPHRPEIVFSAFTTNRDNQARLDIRKADGSIQTLAERGTGARPLPGQLAWARDGRLFASPFDAQQLVLTGPPVPVLDDLSVDAFSGMARFDVSLNGTLVYVAGGIDGKDRELVISNPSGQVSRLPVQARMFEQPAIAPDGHRFVVRTMEGGQNSGLWVGDLAKPALMRLTITQGEPESPVWSPDGTHVAFNAQDPTTSTQRLFVKSADDAGPTRPIWQPPNHAHMGDWAPNGNLLIVMVSDPQSLGDLWTVPLNGDAAAPWLNTQFSEREPRFSPDGGWIAYTSNESGRDEVYARPFPGPGGKVQVSTNGGGQALWTTQGPTAIVYRQGASFMRATVHTAPAFGVDVPTEVVAGDFDSGPVAGQTSYGLTPDGNHLLLVRPLRATAKRSLRVVLNWTQSLALTAAAQTSGGK